MKKILLVCVILALTGGCSTKKVPYVTFKREYKENRFTKQFQEADSMFKEQYKYKKSWMQKHSLSKLSRCARRKKHISNVVLNQTYEFAKHSKPRLTGRSNVLIASSLLPSNRNRRIYSQI